MIVKAPAKINIGLNIVNKRDDGYHDLETLFYPIEKLFDVLTIEENNSLEIISNSEELTNVEDNLIFKAVKLLENITREKINVKIILEKNIPIGGGLGGGSSDAAATLKGVNKLLELNLPTEELKTLALKLGSDVPFFIEGKPAFGFSRGEILEETGLQLNAPILLVNPSLHISTAKAFSAISPKQPEERIKEIISGNPEPKSWQNKITNDFEPWAFSEFPVLKEIKEALYAGGADFALMSGTGATLYGIFPDEEKALRTNELLKKKFLTVIA